MMIVKHVAEFFGVLVIIGAFCWLKFVQIKDHTIFSDSKGPQTLFENDKKEQ
jgi:hypothetical protein